MFHMYPHYSMTYPSEISPRGLPCEVGNSVSITLYDVTQSVALTEDVEGLNFREYSQKETEKAWFFRGNDIWSIGTVAPISMG